MDAYVSDGELAMLFEDDNPDTNDDDLEAFLKAQESSTGGGSGSTIWRTIGKFTKASRTH